MSCHDCMFGTQDRCNLGHTVNTNLELQTMKSWIISLCSYSSTKKQLTSVLADVQWWTSTEKNLKMELLLAPVSFQCSTMTLQTWRPQWLHLLFMQISTWNINRSPPTNFCLTNGQQTSWWTSKCCRSIGFGPLHWPYKTHHSLYHWSVAETCCLTVQFDPTTQAIQLCGSDLWFDVGFIPGICFHWKRVLIQDIR